MTTPTDPTSAPESIPSAPEPLPSLGSQLGGRMRSDGTVPVALSEIGEFLALVSESVEAHREHRPDHVIDIDVADKMQDLAEAEQALWDPAKLAEHMAFPADGEGMRGARPHLVIVDEVSDYIAPPCETPTQAVGQAVTPAVAERIRRGLERFQQDTAARLQETETLPTQRARDVLAGLEGDGILRRLVPEDPIDLFDFVAVRIFGATISSQSDRGVYRMRVYSWTGPHTAHVAEMVRQLARWMPFEVSEMCGPADRLHLFSIAHTAPTEG